MEVTVIGAGLAGCEAAWQLAQRGIKVRLFEMKGKKFSPAHKSEQFAELVCSNSLRAGGLANAVGLLKQEMRDLGSVIMNCADASKVPAGGALAVDREQFSAMVTEKIMNHDNIAVERREVTEIPKDGICIVATGPLTSDALAENIKNYTGDEYLSFFDAAAPIVTYESIDMDLAFFGSRYDKGEDDYINCPMNREEYLAFYQELISAECAELHDFEKKNVFEGCMPVEIMAARGEDTLRFGPLKPVGLKRKGSDERHYAVVQLRREDLSGTMFNLVGFQTHLKWGEQKRVFSMIPALHDAEFVRYGVMHKNTFLNAPKLLNSQYQLIQNPRIFFAGQITGVEGYCESASSGLLAGIAAYHYAAGKEFPNLPETCAIAGLANYISTSPAKQFQPMNVNFSLIPPLNQRIKNKKEKNETLSYRALTDLQVFLQNHEEFQPK